MLTEKLDSSQLTQELNRRWNLGSQLGVCYICLTSHGENRVVDVTSGSLLLTADHIVMVDLLWLVLYGFLLSSNHPGLAAWQMLDRRQSWGQSDFFPEYLISKKLDLELSREIWDLEVSIPYLIIDEKEMDAHKTGYHIEGLSD